MTNQPSSRLPEDSARHPEEPALGHSEERSDEESQDDPKIPWHFWIGVGLVGVYLGYRVIQLIVMGFTNLF